MVGEYTDHVSERVAWDGAKQSGKEDLRPFEIAVLTVQVDVGCRLQKSQKELVIDDKIAYHKAFLPRENL